MQDLKETKPTFAGHEACLCLLSEAWMCCISLGTLTQLLWASECPPVKLLGGLGCCSILSAPSAGQAPRAVQTFPSPPDSHPVLGRRGRQCPVAASSLSLPHFPTKSIPGAPSGSGRPGVLSRSSGVVRGQRLGRPGPQPQPLLGQRGATGVLSCRGRGAAQLP